MGNVNLGEIANNLTMKNVSFAEIANDLTMKVGIDKNGTMDTVDTIYTTLNHYTPLQWISLPSDSNIPKEVTKETRTYLDDKTNNLKIASYTNGKLTRIQTIMPKIVDVQMPNDKVVIVTFADGTEEKAVIDDIDKYASSFEHGISICLTKKMLSMQTANNGSSVYNKLIKYCLKVHRDNRNAEMKAERDANEIKAREQRRKEKAKAKRIKRENAAREEYIEMQKEAYVRAMKEMKKS